MKRTIRDYDLKGKKVIIRVDFNVPIKDGIIQDDNRIRESLQTINYAIDSNAKVILLSHLGKVKTEEDKIKNTLEPISKRLSELLNRKVIFINNTRGKEVENIVNSMNEKDVLLLQNTRYEDLNGKKESSNDPELGAYWASLGDIFINDAFAVSHRAHASNVGIATHLPNGLGFLVEKELDIMLPAINNPVRPFTLILGGSKVSDKIGVIENLVNKADYILIGGAMAFTFLHAKGIEIGASILDKENIDFCKRILKDNEDKIILPIDVICKTKEESITKQCFITDMSKDDIGCDIGPQTTELFNDYLSESKTIIWNGPMGMFEVEKFSYGTKTLLKELSNIQKSTIILGGGDTASAAINYGYRDTFTHISTGGGASLYLLAGKTLPGSDVINDK